MIMGTAQRTKGQVSYFSVAEIKANAVQLKSKTTDVIEYNFEERNSSSIDLQDPVLQNQDLIDHLLLLLPSAMLLTILFSYKFANQLQIHLESVSLFHTTPGFHHHGVAGG